jgi:hypothetical protein
MRQKQQANMRQERNQALQRAGPQGNAYGYGMGFQPQGGQQYTMPRQLGYGRGFQPMPAGQAQMPATAAGKQPGQYSLSNFIQAAQQGGGGRYAQVQNQAQGYRMPRRAVGGQHLNAYQRMQQPTAYGQGYSPYAAGQFGGRPPMQGGYGYQAPNQMQQMGRYQFSPRTYNMQPWGGTQAVQRRPAYPQQQYQQFNRGWY